MNFRIFFKISEIYYKDLTRTNLITFNFIIKNVLNVYFNYYNSNSLYYKIVSLSISSLAK